MISAGEELPELNVGEPKMGRVEQRVNDKAGELDLHNLPPPWVKKTRWGVKKTGCSPPFFPRRYQIRIHAFIARCFLFLTSYVGLKGNEKCLATCLVIGTDSGILIVYVYLIFR